MELKTITVQIKVGKQEKDLELTWNPKAKAYLSSDEAYKVTDPKAKKIQVYVRNDITTNNWKAFKGTARFAPTSESFLSKFFSEPVYTKDDLKERVTEWVALQVEQKEIPGPAKKHVDALTKQFKNFKVALTKTQLREKLTDYAREQRAVLLKTKPLFKVEVEASTPIVIPPPTPTKAEKPAKASKDIANAKVAIDQLDRAIRKLDKSGPKALIADLRAMFLEIDRAGEKVWAVMQKLRGSTDPAAAASVEQLKAARQKYNDAEKKIYELLQRKVATSVAGLEASRVAIEAVAKKGPSAASELAKAKQNFKKFAHTTTIMITSISKAIILPGEKSSPRADAILARLKDVARLSAEVDRTTLAAAATPPPTPAAPKGVTVTAPPAPKLTNVQRALTTLKQQLRFLPDVPPADGSLYDKKVMDRLYASGKLKNTHRFVADLVKVTASFDPDAASVDDLKLVRQKVGAIQSYLVREKIDAVSVDLYKYRAIPVATSAVEDFAWAKNPATRNKVSNLARSIVRDLEALMGPGGADGAKWKASALIDITGKESKLKDFKDALIQAKAILGVAYQASMFGRLPVLPSKEGTPATPAPDAATVSPTVAHYLKTADAALTLVDNAYYQMFKRNPRSPVTGDMALSFIYVDQVDKIPRDIARARSAINALKAPDEKTVKIEERKQLDAVSDRLSEADLKLTRATNRYDELKQLKDGVRERPALSATEKAAIRQAEQHYSRIKGNLDAAISKANATYREFFDAGDKPKPRSLLPNQIVMYETRVVEESRRLEVSLDEAVRSKLPDKQQRAWDDLLVTRGEAQVKLSSVSDRLTELKEQHARAAAKAAKEAKVSPLPPIKATGTAVAPKSAEGLASMDAQALLEEVNRLRSEARATDSLSDATTHRDGIIAIIEEARRRHLSSLEASAQRALKAANNRVVELHGIEKQPRSDAAPPPPADAKPAPAVEPAAAATPSAVELPEAATPVAAEQRRQTEEAKKASAAEEKAKRDAATQEITQLKGRRANLEKELASADTPQKLDDYEKEIKAAIGTLAGHEALIGPFATGVKNTYDILLKRIPALREKLQAAERQGKIDAEVSQLWSKAEALIPQGEAILAKPTVDHADTPQLQKIKGELDGIESRLNEIFTGLPKEQDARRTRIAKHLGNIREVSAKLNDRIQLLTSLAKEDKPGSVAKLRQEASALITQSKKLRKEGKKSADALQPILERLNAIDKSLEAIKAKLADKDPLGQTILDHQIVIATEVGKIEDITKKATATGGTKPATPEPAPAAAPLPGAPTPTAPAPVKGAAPEAAPTPPPPAVKTEPSAAKPAGPTVDLGTITGRISDYKARLSKTTENRDSSTNATALPELIALRKGITRDLSTAQSADPVEAAGIMRGLQDIYFEVVAETASRLRMMSHTPQMKQLQYVLSQFEDLKKDLASIKGVNQDQLSAEIKAIDDSIATVRQDIAQYEQENTPEKRIARLQERLSKLGTVRDIGGGKGIQLDSVTEEYFVAENERLFNGISAIYGKKPVKAVIQALQTDSPIGMAISMALFRKGVAGVPVSDPRMPGSNAKIMLYFDAKDADQMAKVIQREVSDKIKADKQQLEELEQKRIAPFKSLQGVLPSGGKAMEVREPGKPELYVSHVRVTDSAAALQLIRKVATTLKLDEKDDFFVFAHPSIANGLVNGSPAMDLRGSRVFGLTPAAPGEIYIVTRSANAGFSIKHQFGEKEFNLKPYLQKMGAKKNITFSLIVSDTSKQRAQQRAASEAKAAQGLGVKVGSDREVAPAAPPPAPAAPPPAPTPAVEPVKAAPNYGDYVLPKVYTLNPLTVEEVKEQFGTGKGNIAIYQGHISPQEIAKKNKVLERMQNIVAHAKTLGLQRLLIVYRGQTANSSKNYADFVKLAKDVEKGTGFKIEVSLQDFPKPTDNQKDEVSYILAKDGDLADGEVLQQYRQYIRRAWDKSAGQ